MLKNKNENIKDELLNLLSKYSKDMIMQIAFGINEDIPNDLINKFKCLKENNFERREIIEILANYHNENKAISSKSNIANFSSPVNLTFPSRYENKKFIKYLNKFIIKKKKKFYDLFNPLSSNNNNKNRQMTLEEFQITKLKNVNQLPLDNDNKKDKFLNKKRIIKN